MSLFNPKYKNPVRDENISGKIEVNNFPLLLDNDYLDFSMKLHYTKEIKLKVKSFKIEKTIPLAF